MQVRLSELLDGILSWLSKSILGLLVFPVSRIHSVESKTALVAIHNAEFDVRQLCGEQFTMEVVVCPDNRVSINRAFQSQPDVLFFEALKMIERE